MRATVTLTHVQAQDGESGAFYMGQVKLTSYNKVEVEVHITASGLRSGACFAPKYPELTAHEVAKQIFEGITKSKHPEKTQKLNKEGNQ